MFERIVVAVGSALDSDLNRAAASLRRSSGEVHACHVESSQPAATLDGLLAEVTARNADLLVVGARSHSLARRAAMFAPCSVLMVPAGASINLDQVLAPIDFSAASAEAVRQARRLAARDGAAETVLAVESDEDPWLDWTDHPEQYQESLDRFVDASAGLGHGFTCLVEPAHSLPPDAPLGAGLDNLEGARTAASILAVAERIGATLIVAGTRGRTQTAAAILGSVVEKVMQRSTIPVLAVKRPGEQLGLLEGLVQRLRGHLHLVAS
ncbi:MAG: universal stress protein [Bryobacterales bacterium]|nr:universal stress protein [Bryobacterales bacterium]